MTAKGGGARPACASCKYQRRKCPADCLLAPYFPADNQRQFLNCHRLFGVSNITKILKRIDGSELRDVAMKTIIYEANMREYQRVHGCVSVIQSLQQEMNAAKIKLEEVQSEISILQRQIRSLQLGSTIGANLEEQSSSLLMVENPLVENSDEYSNLLFENRISNMTASSVQNPWAAAAAAATNQNLYDPITMTAAAAAAADMQSQFSTIDGLDQQEYAHEILPFFETIQHEDGEESSNYSKEFLSGVDESSNYSKEFLSGVDESSNYSKEFLSGVDESSNYSQIMCLNGSSESMESMQCRVDYDIAENDRELKQAAASFTLTSAALELY